MFAGDARRMIGILTESGSSCGRRLTANLAVALGAVGYRVLLLDENMVAGKAHPDFPGIAGSDLSQVLRGKEKITAVPMKVAPGTDLLAGGLARIGRRPAIETQIAFVNAFYNLAGAYDVVLIDAVGEGCIYPSFTWAAQDVIVLCGDRADSVTTAYARIKALRQAGERRFHLLFEPMPIARAQLLYRNLATASRRHLREFPEDMGTLPQETTGAFYDGLAEDVLRWPLPVHKEGYFRAFMQRLLRGLQVHGPHATVRSN